MSLHFYPPPPDIEPIPVSKPQDNLALGIALVIIVFIAFWMGAAFGLTVNVAHFWMFGQ